MLKKILETMDEMYKIWKFWKYRELESVGRN